MESGTMRWILIGLALTLIAPTALAQTRDQANCANPDPEVGVAGCTALIESGAVKGPALALAYYNRGLHQDVQGHLDEAAADYTKAIALKPDFAAAYNNRCVVDAQKGLLDSAIEDCTRAIKLKADYESAYATRGLAYFQKGQKDEATADWSIAIKLNPGDQNVKNGLASLGATP
jgi:tetratricopeptide (TPR) repeat protein